MQTKNPLKSKTLESLAIIFIIAILNIMGIGEAEPGKTWDTITTVENRRTEQAKNLLTLGAVGGGIYGRLRANTQLKLRKPKKKVKRKKKKKGGKK